MLSISLSLSERRPTDHDHQPCESTCESTVEKISLLIHRAIAVRAAHAEKREACDEIVRRFQDMAFACAYATLGDTYLAKDAAQEAFISAWRNLNQLHVPDAFPDWFKRIVLTQCSRLTRNKQFELVLLEAVAELSTQAAGPPTAGDAGDPKLA